MLGADVLSHIMQGMSAEKSVRCPRAASLEYSDFQRCLVLERILANGLTAKYIYFLDYRTRASYPQEH